MQAPRRKLLIVQVAALGYDLLEANGSLDWEGLRFRPLETVFPAATCPVQASFRTATPPSEHGMVANGIFCRNLRRALFWEQSARLVEGPRIWDAFRAKGGRVAMLFWQQSLGESADILLSPAPIHKHHGGMIQSCYSQPRDLYDRLCRAVGNKFNLMHYWGPRASPRASEWIASATCALLRDPQDAPDLCLAYLPGLDYNLQRHGPDSAQARKDLKTVLNQLQRLLATAGEQGYETIVFGDYAIGPAKPDGAVFPNRVLQEAGLFRTRRVGGKQYPDFYTSDAFAMVDHEMAHIYLADSADHERVGGLLAELPGVESVLDRQGQERTGIAHPNCGELVLVAAAGHWFAYPWWQKDGGAPDYARHVDIHNKPGYDPCELFFGWPPFSVSRNTARIRGSHARTGAGRQAAWTATAGVVGGCNDLLGLANGVKEWLAGARS